MLSRVPLMVNNILHGMRNLICHGNWPGIDIIGHDPSSPSLLTQTLSGILVTGWES